MPLKPGLATAHKTVTKRPNPVKGPRPQPQPIVCTGLRGMDDKVSISPGIMAGGCVQQPSDGVSDLLAGLKDFYQARENG